MGAVGADDVGRSAGEAGCRGARCNRIRAGHKARQRRFAIYWKLFSLSKLRALLRLQHASTYNLRQIEDSGGDTAVEKLSENLKHENSLVHVLGLRARCALTVPITHHHCQRATCTRLHRNPARLALQHRCGMDQALTLELGPSHM